MVDAVTTDAVVTSTPAATPAAVATPAPVVTTATPAAVATPAAEQKAAPTGTLLSNAAAEPVKAPDAAAKTEAVTPIVELKLEIPKNSTLTQADVDGIAALAKSEGMNQKQAAALVTREAAFRSAQLATVQKQFQESAAQFAADPEYGGAKLDQSKVEMRRVLNSSHMPADLKKVLSDPTLPYGDFAPLAKFITNVGRLLGEDGMIPTNRQPSKADVPIHHVFYPPPKTG